MLTLNQSTLLDTSASLCAQQPHISSSNSRAHVPIHAVVLDEHSYLHTVAQKCCKQADVPAASQQNQAGRRAALAMLGVALQTQAGRRAARAKLAMGFANPGRQACSPGQACNGFAPCSAARLAARRCRTPRRMRSKPHAHATRPTHRFRTTAHQEKSTDLLYNGTYRVVVRHKARRTLQLQHRQAVAKLHTTRTPRC